MRKLFYFTFITILFLACKQTGKQPEINLPTSKTSTKQIPETAQKIAKKYGIENWDKVSQIAFTFNVNRRKMPFQRSWVWHPKTGKVTMTTLKDTIKYNRNKIDSLSLKYDKAFINDKYWLLAPFNLVWDKGTSFSEKQKAVAPISKDTLSLLTITYNNDVGYTPGDAYDFYYDTNYLIKEWSFRKGNKKTPSLSTTWEENKTVKDIIFSTMRQDSTGYFKVFFTDISIK